jgi:DNA modification methylase
VNASKTPLPLRFQPNTTSNRLYYGDNLTIMRNMPSACVDLIYLDPPFNSQRNYNLIYKKLTGQPLPEQEEAFCDAWEMDPEKEQMARNMPIVLRQYGADEDLVLFWNAWIKALRHTQPRLLAYLIYMSYRLLEMSRLLKPTGSIFLHCDSTASHYVKVIMDGIFGHQQFRNEIIWRRVSTVKGNAGQGSKFFGPNTDTILFYAKSRNNVFNPQFTEYSDKYLTTFYRYEEPGTGRRYRLISMIGPGGAAKGNPEYEVMGVKRYWRYSKARMQELIESGMVVQTKPGAVPQRKQYLDEGKGVAVQSLWDDIPSLSASSAERLGYATQKPIALLTRIISAASNPGDVVFDPFCGCGTAIYAAHLTGRKWIGCDIAILSVKIVRDVLLKRYGLAEGERYKIDGVPLTVEGAQDMFARDPRQFQHWAVELAGGFASTKHSGDLGVDGRIHYETPDGLRNMVISVKGGKLSPVNMRELHGVVTDWEDTEMGGLICLQEPTKGMWDACARAGIYTYRGRDYHRLQIRTIDDLLNGKGFDTPSRVQTLNWTHQSVLPILTEG